MKTDEDDSRTPWQIDRDNAERAGRHPESWGPFHRHFANDAVHRDGHPECDQPGTPRRVYVFDPDALDAHELIVARYAIAHPEQFIDGVKVDGHEVSDLDPGSTSCLHCDYEGDNP